MPDRHTHAHYVELAMLPLSISYTLVERWARALGTNLAEKHKLEFRYYLIQAMRCESSRSRAVTYIRMGKLSDRSRDAVKV